jgi:transcription elongation factor Elf1
MRAVVTCECCGHRQAVARAIARPQSFHLVCHACEGVLRVEVTAEDLRVAREKLAPLRAATRV